MSIRKSRHPNIWNLGALSFFVDERRHDPERTCMWKILHKKEFLSPPATRTFWPTPDPTNRILVYLPSQPGPVETLKTCIRADYGHCLGACIIEMKKNTLKYWFLIYYIFMAIMNQVCLVFYDNFRKLWTWCHLKCINSGLNTNRARHLWLYDPVACLLAWRQPLPRYIYEYMKKNVKIWLLIISRLKDLCLMKKNVKIWLLIISNLKDLCLKDSCKNTWTIRAIIEFV